MNYMFCQRNSDAWHKTLTEVQAELEEQGLVYVYGLNRIVDIMKVSSYIMITTGTWLADRDL